MFWGYGWALKALTIAIRYGAVRRQFASGKNKIETQLLDYPTHMRRLFVSRWLIAQAAFHADSILQS